jgi:energy-coupling factor transporter transmembrane protein EcfT
MLKSMMLSENVHMAMLARGFGKRIDDKAKIGKNGAIFIITSLIISLLVVTEGWKWLFLTS